MRFASSSVVGLVSLVASGAVAAPNKAPKTVSLEKFVATEKAISLQGVLDNIGPHGSRAPGAGAGYVVASPSTVNPDYFYTWSRDSALTLKMIVDEFIFGNKKLESYITDYVHAQAVLQTVSNPSGTFLPQGLGLGEPKYMVDGTRYNGAWGRPQRDGPALRAIALTSYSKYLIEHGKADTAKKVIWPVIANDLSYVGQYWNQTGFDLWEETLGSSFFTLQNSHRALSEGADLARELRVSCTGCDQAPEVLCFLQSFWNGEYVVSNLHVDNGRTGLDGNSILGPISIFDIDAECDGPIMQPCHSKTLANFKAIMDTFREGYSINANIPTGSGIAVGRYMEDVYMGGNPWYLITSAAAELLYDAVAQWKKQRSLTIDSTSLAFFKEIYPAAKIGKYNILNKFSEFVKIMDAVTTYADSFVAIVQKYTPADGSLSEQFNRDNGTALSAVHLTWSYAAFVTMSNRRAGNFPASWGSNAASNMPKTCSATSTQGVYVPALAAGAPNVTASCQINVSFNVNATTYYGENLYIVGSTDDLGAWTLGNAYPMSAGSYTPDHPVWSVSSFLNAGETVNYKYVRQEDCNQPYIYETQNRTLTVPACGSAGITVNDDWVGPVGSTGGC